MNPISPADLAIPHAIKSYSGALTPSILQPHVSPGILRSPKGGWCFLRSFLSWVNTGDQLFLSPEFSSISGSFSFLPPYSSPKLWPWSLFSLDSHTVSEPGHSFCTFSLGCFCITQHHPSQPCGFPTGDLACSQWGCSPQASHFYL